MDIKKLHEQYSVVFDENGNVRTCGRDACKALIRMCQEIQPGGEFGNEDTGMMNVENIKRMIERLR